MNDALVISSLRSLHGSGSHVAIFCGHEDSTQQQEGFPSLSLGSTRCAGNSKYWLSLYNTDDIAYPCTAQMALPIPVQQ